MKLLKNNIGQTYPSLLYKYKGEENYIHLEDLIKNKQIFLSTPEILNDPLDMRFRISERLLREEANKRNFGDAVNEGIDYAIGFEDFRDEHSIYTNEYIRKHGVLFCMTSDENNPLLWSYYSNGYRGYRLEFDFSLENNTIQQSIFPVSYVPELPLIDSNDAAFATSFTKLDFWKHENEYRLILIAHEDGKSEYYPIKNTTLKNITFGYKVPDDVVKKFIELLFENNMFQTSVNKISFNGLKFGNTIAYNGKPLSYLNLNV